jgi:hypothetical protein
MRIVLTCADGHDGKVVARRRHVTSATVSKWRGRFVRDRLNWLYDEPRPWSRGRVTDEQIKLAIVRTLETTSHGATHWSARGMAEAAGLRRMAINRIRRAFGLQPYRAETFTLPKDPLLVVKRRDIVGLYLNPPEYEAVFCVDEKPQIQALDLIDARVPPNWKCTSSWTITAPRRRHSFATGSPNALGFTSPSHAPTDCG